MQKETAAAREEMLKIRENIIQKDERVLLLSDKVAQQEMAEPEMEAELQGSQAAMRRRQLIVAGRRWSVQFAKSRAASDGG